MTQCILLVEDDDTLGLSLEISLTSKGQEVVWVQTLAAAVEAEKARKPALVILDLGLPDGDGLTLCRSLRAAENRTPILILTARGTVEARVEGLDAGADDYLTKPFELPELLARVDALLRRKRWMEAPEERTTIGRLRVDFERFEASTSEGRIEMTELEFRLLRYLVQHRGRTVTREDLLTKVWDRPADARTRSVDVLVSRLRKRIESPEEVGELLVTVRGVGYRLENAPPPEAPAPANNRPEDDPE